METKLLYYDKLNQILKSLKSSTNISVCFSDVCWSFSRLNSEYSSRRIVKMKAGHLVDDLIVIQNDRYWLGITKYHIPEIVGDVVTIPLPHYHISKLFSFPATAPNWCQNGVLRIHIPDLFTGYDNEGNPLFKPYGKIRAIIKETETDETIWEYKDPTFVGSVDDDHLVYWDGSFLTVTPFGTFAEGDIVSTELAEYYNIQLDNSTSYKLDDLLGDIGLELQCGGDISECQHHDNCKDCKYNTCVRLVRI